ncbi:MAG: glycosyltransferase [Tissierellales bacterium]|nr:glycosyltransferase [Tissierellales bacterium]
MKIMVFDVAAESGGALTILNQYYDSAIKDKDNEWIFVVSTPELKETDNVKVLNYPWIKKSWFHRLYFDYLIANKLVKKNKVEEILSLQNVVVSKVKVKQTLYLHQPLPFIEKRYGLIENFKFWLYQNIISKIIYKSIREADEVIVQTKWIMEAATEKANVKKDKFILKQPELNVSIKTLYTPDKNSENLFFYPASGLTYKNHEVIVNACKLLKHKGISNYKVLFTLKGDENKHIKKLKQIVLDENLPIEFIGTIDIDTVYEYYSKSILIFPSYIETFGLPMLEAKMHETPILASDCAFSKEILDGYEKVEFFDPFDHQSLANMMLRNIIKCSF